MASCQGGSQGPWEERETPPPPGGSFMFSLLILRNSSLPAPGQESAPSHGKSEGGPFLSDPTAPCRVLHQQDPFEGLRGSPGAPSASS